MRAPRRRGVGFTLIEVLVVVTIVALLSAIGVHQLTRARIVTNEQLALNSLRLIAQSAQFFYLAQQAYPAALADLGPPASTPPYIQDGALLGGLKQGYRFVYAPDAGPTPTAFTVLANPETHQVTGVRHFYTDQTLVIHATQQDRDATAADSVVE